MAAGLTQITILDGNATPRTVQVWSSDGTINGQLSFLQTIAGADETNPVSGSNPLPISGSISATNPSVSTTGTAVPGSATYLGVTVGGVLTGLVATANGLKIDGSAVTQPVSQATAANLNATVVGTGTFAVQVGSSALPTGAATAANQTSVIGSPTGGTAGTSSLLTGGIYNSSAPTLTTGQQAAHQLDANGNLKVAIVSGGGSGGTASSYGSAFPATGTAIGFKTSSGTLMAAGNLDSSGNIMVNVAAGGAGGGAVYGPTAVGSAAANPPVLIGGTANATATGNVEVAKVDSSGNQYTVLSTGANVIGSISNTSFAATQSGTWNVGLSTGANTIGAISNTSFAATQATAANLNATVVGTGTFAVQATVAAGSAIIGNVRIDQTTPGTTNGVQVNAALPAGANSIGTVVLGAGSATIGALTANQTVNQTQVGGIAVAVGNGTTNPGTMRVTLSSDSTGQVAVTNSSFAVTQATAASLNATVVGTGTFAVQAAGPTAAGSTLTASPLTAGGLAKTANPTAVADGQVVNYLHDKLGKAIAVSALRNLKAIQTTTITSSTAETTIITAVASTFLDLYRLVISNTSATAVNVTIKDATAGTTRFVFAVPANDVRGFSTDAGSATPQAVVNNNWTATCSASVASVIISAEYVQNL